MELPQLEIGRICKTCKFFVNQSNRCKLPGIQFGNEDTRSTSIELSCSAHLWRSRARIDLLVEKYQAKTPDEFT